MRLPRNRMQPDQDLTGTSSGLADAGEGKEKPRLSGALSEADEGTRTLDLLHGKQTL